jgi:hypothetical protein
MLRPATPGLMAVTRKFLDFFKFGGYDTPYNRAGAACPGLRARVDPGKGETPV